MALMTDRHFRHLPVLTDDDELVGIISIGDVVKNVVVGKRRHHQSTGKLYCGPVWPCICLMATFKVNLNGRETEIEAVRQGDHLRVIRDGQAAELQLVQVDGATFVLAYERPDGSRHIVRAAAHVDGDTRQLWVNGRFINYERARRRAGGGSGTALPHAASPGGLRARRRRRHPGRRGRSRQRRRQAHFVGIDENDHPHSSARRWPGDGR